MTFSKNQLQRISIRGNLYIFRFLGYGDRRRYNDNENNVYDAQETDGKHFRRTIFIRFAFFLVLSAENQHHYNNNQYHTQRNRYGGYRNHRGGGGGNNYRYNHNNTGEFYEDSYIDVGQTQPIPAKKSQQTLENNGVSSTDVSATEPVNGNGPKGQRPAKQQQSNGVK